MKYIDKIAIAVAFAVLAGSVGIAHSQHYGTHGQTNRAADAVVKVLGDEFQFMTNWLDGQRK